MNENEKSREAAAGGLGDTVKILQAMRSTKRKPRPQLSNPYEAPSTPAETKLAELCADILKLESVGVKDNLQDLGASSIHFAQLSSRISDAFDVELSFRAIFDSPTVAGIAVMLEKGEK